MNRPKGTQILLSLVLLFLVTTTTDAQDAATPPRQINKFPDNFLLGSATSSYQIEGAWNVDGEELLFLTLSRLYLRGKNYLSGEHYL